MLVIKIEKEIPAELRDEMQKVYYSYKAVENLITKEVSNPVILERHAEKYQEYNMLWNEILREYFGFSPNKDSDAKWSMDFITSTVTLEIGENITLEVQEDATLELELKEEEA